jgi:XTP/dITP diphosphohydrolase
MKERVEENEKYFDNINELVSNMDKMLKDMEKIKPQLDKITEYYGSEDWFKDIEAHTKKEIETKAGVLSEDGVWNMQEKFDENLHELRELTNSILNERQHRVIVLASNNEHKIKEFKKMLPDYNILSLKEIDYTEDIEETGETFEENALLKAKTIHDFLQKEHPDYIVIADDSGLCCEALDGAPGVYSARYAGGHGNNEANRKKLQKELKDKDRTAYFNCTIVVYYPDDTHKVFVGKTYGKITEDERGDKSFGYDCIFLSDDLNKTFGEATEEEKNSVSHRGRAIEEMLKEL